MVKRGKKYSEALKKIEAHAVYPIKEAVSKVKDIAFANFDESVDADVVLGIDASRGEQMVRGSVMLPHRSGKDIRVIVFAKGEHAEAAEAAGADVVGSEDLIEKISEGWLDFDYAVATPDIMGKVGKLAKLLGPRGLLPNKKVGTVTFDVGPIIKDLKSGRLFFKNDKQGSVHIAIGKVSMSPEQIQANLVAFLKALAASRPSSAKGKFIKELTISSTMGPGIQTNPDEVVNL